MNKTTTSSDHSSVGRAEEGISTFVPEDSEVPGSIPVGFRIGVLFLSQVKCLKPTTRSHMTTVSLILAEWFIWKYFTDITYSGRTDVYGNF